jgi:hypothetical protein
MRLWRESKQRKPRSDSKLHGLAKEQRALVDKWLFDKGLTYQEVSEGCLAMFGLKVSKSSVGRYHERGASARALWKVRRKKGRQSLHPMVGTLEENYQYCLKRMAAWALEEMKWPVADERDVKTVLRFMRILIASRRERNEENMTKLAREKFEMKAGRQCLHLMLNRNGEGKGATGMGPGIEQKQTKVTKHGQRGEGLRRGEKDPMMVWNFPDGEIRRMPLMRQQAEPAPIRMRSAECGVRNEPPEWRHIGETPISTRETRVLPPRGRSRL